MKNEKKFSIGRLGLTGAATLAAVGLVTAPAAAHVSISPGTATAGSYEVLTIGVPHGCEDSSTTSVEISIPEEVLRVVPTVNSGWDIDVTKVKLDPVVTDSHGNEITERTSLVTYVAKKPLQSDLRDAFELSIKVPDVEETLVFPAVQKCEKGEIGWIQTAAEGQDPHELEYPAPTLTVTAAESQGHDHEAEEMDQAAADAQVPESSTSALTWVALATGVVGVVLALVAFASARRKQ